MRACLGTTNPSKITGVLRALRSVFGDVDLVSFKVSTAIPPQPMGLHIVIEGAKRRAIEAVKAGTDCDIGIGVEAGLYIIEGRFFDVQVVYIVSREGLEAFGLSPSFSVPDLFVKELILGNAKELEEVVDKYFGTTDVGSKGGLVRILTRSAVDREDLTYYATMMALIPLINKELYSKL